MFSIFFTNKNRNRPHGSPLHFGGGKGLTGSLGLVFLLGGMSLGRGQTPVVESATLRFAQGPGQGIVSILRTADGKLYLPLRETARYYGVEIEKDDLDGKITLTKGDVRVRLALSQPFFLVMQNEDSYPMDPAETVNGEVGLPPASAEDLLSVLLDQDVRWDWDRQTLVAGEVNAQELRQEIMNAKATPVSPSTPLAVAEATPVAEETPEAEAPIARAPLPSVLEAQRVSDNKQYHVRRIIIDPGHGGKDYGASGFDRRYYEKQATLEIAKKVVALLQKDPDLDVFLTRTGDYYISLNYRTEYANSRNADLFVSIHCNSNPRSKATGTETYKYGARASNQRAAYQASRENGKGDYLDFIKSDMLHNKFGENSGTLAEFVDKNIRKNLGQQIRRIQTAPFYVLCHVNMPSILVETAFISNPKEEQKLRNGEWQDKIARSIADGILAYRDKVEKSDDNRQAKR